MSRVAPKSLLCAFAVLVGSAQAEFPPIDKLPSQAGLPDPLTMLDGRKVSTKEDWSAKRRPELKALFAHYMYGERPELVGSIVAKVAYQDDKALQGKATLRDVAISFDRPGSPTIHLLVVIPNKIQGKVPIFLGANFYGNHAVLDHPVIPLPTAWVPDKAAKSQDNKATEAGRGFQRDTWSIEANIDRGFAVATFYCGDVAPDHPGLADGIFALESKTKRGASDWSVVSAWAWGIEKAIDYLVTDPRIDAGRIAVVGHSRLGKASILAGALDDRIAIVTSHQAGCGGTAPSRGKVGESVKQINDRFPHWFCDEFKAFNDTPEKLPFDQNGLFALVAPRPLLLTNGVEDTWANPAGQFEALVAADAVYRFLGAGGLDSKTMPAVGTLSDGKLGYHIRPGKHSMTLDDWKVWWTFADKHFKSAAH